MPEPPPPGAPPDRELVALVDRLIETDGSAHSVRGRYRAVMRQLEADAARVFEHAGADMVLIRNGKALVPFESDGRRGYDVLPCRDVDLIAHDDWEARVLEAGALAIETGRIGESHRADLLSVIRLGTDCTEEESFAVIAGLCRIADDVEPPAEMVDLVKVINQVLGDLRRSRRPPVVDGPPFEEEEDTLDVLAILDEARDAEKKGSPTDEGDRAWPGPFSVLDPRD